MLPRPFDLLLIVAVLTSASASTQTTSLPRARTTLSMARWAAVSKAFGQVHPRYQAPTFSTLLMGAMVVMRLMRRSFPAFFARRPEVADPALLAAAGDR